MPAEIISSNELLDYVNRGGYTADFSDAQLEDKINKTTDRIRQAALNWYTAASFEALTAATSPPEMKDYALALALDALTRADAGRADSIGRAADKAAAWLGFMAAGKTHYDESPGAILAKITDSFVVTRAQSERAFDRNNSSQDYNDRNPKI